jgi:hypothetical protein
MNWRDFVYATDSTAVYPEAGTGSVMELCYVALGLAGELGEAVEVSDRPELVKAELADALWYVARGIRALQVHGYPFAEVCPDNAKNVEAAPLLVANTTKKLLRDGLGRDKLDALAVLYRNSLDALYQMIRELEMGDFEDLLSELVLKLNSRKDRGVLHGSGDNR